MNTAARMRDGCKAAVCSASAKTRFALALALALCASLALAAPMAAQPWVANRIAQATNDLARSIPPPDYSPSNAALRATIETVAPAPGDYATVSNRAVNAVLWDSSMEYQEGHNSLNLGYAGLNWWEQIKLEPVWSGDGNGVRFAQEISPGGWQESELYPDGSPIATSNMAERIARQYAGSGGGGEPGDYANVSNRAMHAVTTNANGTAEIYGRSHALFLHPNSGYIEWEGPDVSAYIGLPKRSGTFALTDDIPSTNGLFCVNKQAALPDGFAYIYGTMWQSSLYSVNLGFEFDANSCNYILPPPEYLGQNVYLASTNYVQKAVATAATAATNYTDRAVALARAAKDYHWDAAQGVLYRTDFDGGYVYLTPVTNVNALAEGNESILEYLEAHRND